jgi:hypothetical protein
VVARVSCTEEDRYQEMDRDVFPVPASDPALPRLSEGWQASYRRRLQRMSGENRVRYLSQLYKSDVSIFVFYAYICLNFSASFNTPSFVIGL